MAKLTTAGRKKIATKNFALPGRRYPIEDTSHAKDALSRVSANGSSSEKATVRAKVKSKYPSMKVGDAKGASQPHPETNPGFYDTEPHAPGNKIANKPLGPPPAVGGNTPAMVPKAPGRVDGLGGAPHQFSKPPAGSHGFGHGVTQRVGHMRVSGHSSAHRIGKR